MSYTELNVFDPIQQACFFVSVSIGIGIRFLTHKTTAPPLKIICLFQLSSFFMSMVWIAILCEVIVDLLELFGILTQLPTSLLGLTVLSWGNSLGDCFACLSIAKNGFGEMALTGCIAGPAFNLMIGLGVTTLMCNLKTEGGITFDIHNSEGLSTLATLLATLIVLFMLVWVVWINNFKTGKGQVGMLATIYAISILFIGVASL